MLTIGSAFGLQLQDAHIDSHLEDMASIGRFHPSGQHLARLKRPLLQDAIDIKPSRHGDSLDA
jgi:hypothetical protein